MGEQTKLPVGIENFEEIRSNGYYYIDKTKLIEQLLDNRGKVNLFTRPRRFGKTLNMSMLKCFFEIGTDPALFDGLAISSNEQLCKEYMLSLIHISESLGGVESLITYPMFQTHGDVPPEVRERLGITDCFLRFSVGIENADDLIADLKQALED